MQGVPELPPLRLAPGLLSAPISLRQVLTVRQAGRDISLEALLEADNTSLRLFVQAFGRPALRLAWDGKTLKEARSPGLPDALRGQQVLDDLQLAYWPLGAIRVALPNGWRMDNDAHARRLRSPLPLDAVVVEVEDLGDGHLRISHPALGLVLDIASQPGDGP
jgi:hypothetical protein